MSQRRSLLLQKELQLQLQENIQFQSLILLIVTEILVQF